MKNLNRKEMTMILDSMYNANDVELNYKFWFTQLLSITMSMFKWENLPDSISGREIELELQLTGHCVLYYVRDKLLTSCTNIYGFDDYYQPTNFIYAQPKQGNGNRAIDSKTATIIYNNILKDNLDGFPIDSSLRSYISYYARQLSDISSTINIYTVNSRITDYPVAKNDKVKASLEKFFDLFRLGKHAIVTTDNELALSVFDVKDKGHNNTSDTLINYIDASDRMLENFYRGIGVKFKNSKRAQVNVEETQADEQVLVVSVADMLRERQKGVKILNNKFGLNVTVDLNDEFKREKFGGEYFTNERNEKNE